MYMFFILVTLAMHFIVHKIKVCSKFLEKIGSCVIINLHTNVGYIITTSSVTKLNNASCDVIHPNASCDIIHPLHF